MQALTDLSIIIVSYNTRDLLRDCLASVERCCSGASVETFVVDNASSDGSAEMVAREFPLVELIVNESNVGFAAANNIGLRRAAGRYVALLNPDTRLSPGALPELVRFMDARPRAGYCGPRLVNANGTNQPSAHRFPTIVSAGFSILGLARRYPASRHTLDLHVLHGHRAHFRADWLGGACLMVATPCLHAVGLLDEGFFMYFEETDWCRRMAKAGWEGWYVPSAEVTHLGGQSVTPTDEIRPFSGDHPVYWVTSSRRFMRRYHGVPGMVVSEAIQVGLYSLIWLRRRWRRGERSYNEARRAAAAIRHLLARPRCRHPNAPYAAGCDADARILH